MAVNIPGLSNYNPSKPAQRIDVPSVTINSRPSATVLPARPSASVLGTSTYQPSSSPQPSQAFNNSVPEIPTPSAPQIDFDALIAPALQALDEAVGPLQQSYDTNVQSINSNRQNQLDYTDANIKSQSATLDQTGQKQQQLSDNAADKARRQFSELQQGIQAKYGGTTGTGAFANELAGRETIGMIGNIRQGLSDAMMVIGQKKQQVQEIGRIAVQDIEDKARDQLSEAKNQLDSALADIRRQKGELQARKAELAANAIQIYQNTVNQVNQQNAAFKQQIYLQQQSAMQNLQLAGQRASDTANSVKAVSPNVQGVDLFSQADMQRYKSGQAAVGGGNLAQFGNYDAYPTQQSDDYYTQLQRQLGV